MKTFTHIHSSSKFNRTPASLDKALDRYTLLADIITLTEVNRESREKALPREGWGVITGDKSGWDDCGLVYKKERFRVLHRESFDMGGTGRWAQIVVLQDKTNNKIAVWGVAHYPSSVETELSRRQRTADSIMWTKCVWSLKRRVNKLKRRFKANAAFIAADWNVNFKRDWARRLIKSIHPAWDWSWRAPWPVGGTHFSRLIDATLYRGVRLAKQARLMADDASSDHRPYIDSFNWV